MERTQPLDVARALRIIGHQVITGALGLQVNFNARRHNHGVYGDAATILIPDNFHLVG